MRTLEHSTDQFFAHNDDLRRRRRRLANIAATNDVVHVNEPRRSPRRWEFFSAITHTLHTETLRITDTTHITSGTQLLFRFSHVHVGTSRLLAVWRLGYARLDVRVWGTPSASRSERSR